MGILGLAGSTGFGVWGGIPLPTISDEFSYLLAGDTFANGRLTNPTHPFWPHFEALHVLHVPSYQSKYPPGQGVFLAVGELIASVPALGVWLSSGLLAAALGWGLLMWLPAQWGVLAGLAAVSRLTWFEYWAQSYWGGNVAAIGGALALGVLGRMMGTPRTIRGMHGLLLGTGVGVMAFSRPLEGLVTTTVIVVILLHSSVHPTLFPTVRRQLRSLCIPASVAVLVFLSFLAAYNHSVTGSLKTMPYEIHEQQYAAAPTFLWQEVQAPPTYRHVTMERTWLIWGAERHRNKQAASGLVHHLATKSATIALFFLGPGLVALAGLLNLIHRGRLSPRHRSRARLLTAVILIVTIPVLSTKAAWPHYIAPVTVLLFAIMGIGLMGLHRRARSLKRLNLAAAIAVAFAMVAFVKPLVSPVLEHDQFALARESVRQEVLREPGGHLIIVEFAMDGLAAEWIHNAADIDASRAVWARSIGPDEDQALMEYFRGRTKWLLTILPSHQYHLRRLDSE